MKAGKKDRQKSRVRGREKERVRVDDIPQGWIFSFYFSSSSFLLQSLLPLILKINASLDVRSGCAASLLFSVLHNALTWWRIVVSASSQSRGPVCRRFEFPVFAGSDYSDFSGA